MARFYGSVKGKAGEAIREGNVDSGIQAHIRGWDFGVEVFGFKNTETSADMFSIYLTGGSNHKSVKRFLGTYTREDLSK